LPLFFPIRLLPFLPPLFFTVLQQGSRSVPARFLSSFSDTRIVSLDRTPSFTRPCPWSPPSLSSPLSKTAVFHRPYSLLSPLLSLVPFRGISFPSDDTTQEISFTLGPPSHEIFAQPFSTSCGFHMRFSFFCRWLLSSVCICMLHLYRYVF